MDQGAWATLDLTEKRGYSDTMRNKYYGMNRKLKYYDYGAQRRRDVTLTDKTLEILYECRLDELETWDEIIRRAAEALVTNIDTVNISICRDGLEHTRCYRQPRRPL